MTLRWRVVGSSFEAYPDWVKSLRGKSGAYAIRDRATHQVLYVGESHSGKLHETLTRHLQTWHGPTAGPTYRRDQIEVAVRLTRADRARAEQDRLICRLKPEANLDLPPCSSSEEAARLDDVPF